MCFPFPVEDLAVGVGERWNHGESLKGPLMHWMRSLFDKEVNLMRGAPNPYQIEVGLLVNSSHNTRMPPCHCVLTISAKSNDFALPVWKECIKNALDHCSNVWWGMPIIEWHCHQISVVQLAIGTKMNSNIKIQNWSMCRAITSKRECPNLLRF